MRRMWKNYPSFLRLISLEPRVHIAAVLEVAISLCCGVRGIFSIFYIFLICSRSSIQVRSHFSFLTRWKIDSRSLNIISAISTCSASSYAVHRYKICCCWDRFYHGIYNKDSSALKQKLRTLSGVERWRSITVHVVLCSGRAGQLLEDSREHSNFEVTSLQLEAYSVVFRHWLHWLAS